MIVENSEAQFFDKTSRIAIIGTGRVGGSLALAFHKAGYPVVSLANRNVASAKLLSDRLKGCTGYNSFQEAVESCNIAFITTSDDAISSVTSSINWQPGQAVIHCSGATSIDIFSSIKNDGIFTGAFHPLQAFSSVELGLKSIPGTTFGIEAYEPIKEYLFNLAKAIGGHPITVTSKDRVLYHLSGVLMGNLLTGFIGVSGQLWEQFGYTRAQGIKALLPMAQAVLNNVHDSGIPDAVAGPYSRGDLGTITKHIQALKHSESEILQLYRALALATLPLCVEGGLAPDIANEIESVVGS